MIPLVDIHCHLLAGLDDGPRTDAEALQMCRLAWMNGTQLASALAHQNERWPAVTPQCIRNAASRLVGQLRLEGIGLAVFPSAEVMVHLGIEEAWCSGALMSVADRGQYLLIEMPDGLFVDLAETVRKLCAVGARPILAHPERQSELLHDEGRIDDLVRAGCLVQVSASSVTRPSSGRDERAIKDWFRRGLVHVLGSDGHSPVRRRPLMADAYARICRWVGPAAADRVCSTNGTAIVQGSPLRLSPPRPRTRRWLPILW